MSYPEGHEVVMNASEIDFDARYKVDGYGGVAFYLHSWVKMWDEVLEEWVDDPDYNMVIAIMVGDDREHYIDIADLTKIHDDDYCSGCGQIGCTADSSHQIRGDA